MPGTNIWMTDEAPRRSLSDRLRGLLPGFPVLSEAANGTERPTMSVFRTLTASWPDGH
jgi:hypothetical protein